MIDSSRGPASPHDELLQPSVAAAAAPGRTPWRVQSQFWVAFFGGSLAVFVIALLNARRLAIEPERRRLAWLAGLVALGVTAGLYLAVPLEGGLVESLRSARWLRWTSRLLAVLLWLVLAAVQRPGERRHQMFGTGEHASLWRAGLLAVFGLGTIQSVLMAGLLWMVKG